MSVSFNPAFLKITIIDMDDILRNQHLMTMCRTLSLGGNSGMNACLGAYSKLIETRSVDSCGIFAYYLDIPVGWCMYTYEDDQFCFRPKEGEAVSHIYVHEQWRRLGIGGRLIQVAQKMAMPDVLRVYEHNNYSFFRPLIQKMNNLAAV
jgi:GNAT superfamily N-acetyltransferase